MFFVNVPLKLLSAEAFFSPKCTKYRLVARLRPNPLGKLTAFPRPHSWISWGLFLSGGKERREKLRREEIEGVTYGESKEWGRGKYASLALEDGRP